MWDIQVDGRITSDFFDLSRAILSIFIPVRTRRSALRSCNKVAPYTCPIALRRMFKTEKSVTRTLSISCTKSSSAFEEESYSTIWHVTHRTDLVGKLSKN